MNASRRPAQLPSLRRLFRAPRLPDPEETATARIVWGFAWALIATTLAGNLLEMFLEPSEALARLLTILVEGAAAVVVLVLAHTRRVTAAALVLLIAGGIAEFVVAWTEGGLASPEAAAPLVVVVSAGLLLGWRAGVGAAVLGTATVFALAWAEVAGVLPPVPPAQSPWAYATIFAAFIAILAVLVAIAVRNKERAAEKALQDVMSRVAAETALAESRAVLSAVVEGTSDAVWVRDRDGRFLFMNDAAGRALDINPAQAIGRDPATVFPQGQAAGAAALARVNLVAQRPETREELITDAQGSGRWYLTATGPLHMADGETIGSYAISRDITERKQAEERMRATLDSLLDPHVLVEAIRADGRIVDFVCIDSNEATSAYLGIDREQVLGAHLLNVLPVQGKDGLLGLWTDTVESGVPLVLDDVPLPTAFGESQRYFDLRGVRVGDGLSFTLRNVTERHSMERSLRRRIQELDALQRISRLLAEQSDLAVALAAANGEVLRLFAACYAQLHLLPAEGEAEPITLLSHAATAPADLAPSAAADAVMQQALASGEPACGSGSGEPEQHVMSVAMVSGSRIIGALTLARNHEAGAFTEAELLVARPVADALAAAVENERLHRRERRQAADDERQRLARDLHDAVTQSIYAANLIAGALPDIWRRSPDQGLTELDTLRRLVRAALAEMRTLLFELRPATLDDTPLETLLHRLAEALEGHALIDVDVAVEPDLALPRDVKLVFYRIAQEALSNVGKYSGATEAMVRATGTKAGARLMVRDDGRGFDEGATRPDSLGLRIMRERAAEIGATIAVQSTVGRGTTVMVDWPRVPELDGEGPTERTASLLV